jgi:NAD(P)-dependent dehydrogenase (short-subunit alcohol dehydrogenase family)
VIINIASVQGVQSQPVINLLAYHKYLASGDLTGRSSIRGKQGRCSLSDKTSVQQRSCVTVQMALEYGKQGIRVLAVNPATVRAS